MAIYEYVEGELKSGFVGIRISVSIGNKTKQKYLNYSKKGVWVTELQKKALWGVAHIIHEQFLAEKEEATHQKMIDSIPDWEDTFSSTGVAGIRLIYGCSRGRDKKKKYWHPMFAGNTLTNKKHHSFSYALNKHGLNLAFYLACENRAENKGIADFNHWLARCPSIDQVHRAREHCEQINNIKLAVYVDNT